MDEEFDLLYRSRALTDPNSIEDLQILCQSIRNNERNGLNGFLWRAQDEFFQALRGPLEKLEPLMRKLKVDNRHAAIEILLFEPSSGAVPFKGWAMGYDLASATLLDMVPEPRGPRPKIDRNKARAIFSLAMQKIPRTRSAALEFDFAPGHEETPDQYRDRMADLLQEMQRSAKPARAHK